MAKPAKAMENISESIDAVTLTPGEGANLIVGSYIAGTYKRTLLFRGAPGIGKTSLARNAAIELRNTYPDFQYIEINPTMPADEVGGIFERRRIGLRRAASSDGAQDDGLERDHGHVSVQRESAVWSQHGLEDRDRPLVQHRAQQRR